MLARALNFIVDISVISVLTWFGLVLILKQIEPTLTIYGYLTENNLNLLLNLYFFGSLFIYYVLFEHFTGRTPGKFVTGTMVVNDEGTKASLKQIVIRTLIRLIPLDWISYFRSKPIGWHDSISDTLVVERNTVANKRYR